MRMSAQVRRLCRHPVSLMEERSSAPAGVPVKRRLPDQADRSAQSPDRFSPGGLALLKRIVSDDKPERDLVDKLGDYAEARVPEYSIVNPRSETPV
jgi:Putative restriction endonuclease